MTGKTTAGLPTLYTPQELSEALKLDVKTVRARFREEPGVIRIPCGEVGEKIRVPQEVLDRYLRRHAAA